LSRKADLRDASVEDDEHALQGSIAKDVEARTGAAVLDATEAVPTAVVEWRIVAVATWDGARLAIDVEGEIRQDGVAREGHSTPAVAESSARDLVVVLGDESGGKPVDGCTGVGDGVLLGGSEVSGGDSGTTDCEGTEVETPVSLCVIYRCCVTGQWWSKSEQHKAEDLLYAISPVYFVGSMKPKSKSPA